MKKFKTCILLIFLSVSIACNQSENSDNEEKEQQKNISDNEDVASVSDEKKKVASAVDSLNFTIVNPDEVILGKLTAENLTYGHSSGLVQNKEEFIDDLVNGDFNFSSINALNQSIQIIGKTAIVRHIFSAKATKAGEPIDIRIGNILVFQKQEEEWKLIARQAFKL